MEKLSHQMKKATNARNWFDRGVVYKMPILSKVRVEASCIQSCHRIVQFIYAHASFLQQPFDATATPSSWHLSPIDIPAYMGPSFNACQV